ncbi:uncharacterized protein [Temnothorax nylanderi]|uniref:uncharacterized protein isoform X1 n=1 Tax=Temnothorax nylanderi TaxID=102681 RepID=UPI003A8A43A6
MEEVRTWLLKNGLSELVCRFENEKINSLRRVSVLTQDLIRELIPEVGLRADFENCLNDFKTSPSKEIGRQTYTDILTENLNNDEDFISQLMSGKEISLPILQMQSCKNIDQTQENETRDKNLEGENFEDSRAGSSISDTVKEGETSDKKRSSSKSNCGSNKRLATLKGFSHLKELDLETYFTNFDLASEAAVNNYKFKGTLNEKDRTAITNAVVHEMLRVNYVTANRWF